MLQFPLGQIFHGLRIYWFNYLQVLLAIKANVEDRGIKGDCTPLMEAASGGYVDIVKLLISHEADVNAQSSAGKLKKELWKCDQQAKSWHNN